MTRGEAWWLNRIQKGQEDSGSIPELGVIITFCVFLFEATYQAIQPVCGLVPALLAARLAVCYVRVLEARLFLSFWPF